MAEAGQTQADVPQRGSVAVEAWGLNSVEFCQAPQLGVGLLSPSTHECSN